MRKEALPGRNFVRKRALPGRTFVRKDFCQEAGSARKEFCQEAGSARKDPGLTQWWLCGWVGCLGCSFAGPPFLRRELEHRHSGDHLCHTE